MTLNPFVFGGDVAHPRCFDEDPPCTLEQTTMCVIDVAKQMDASSAFPGQRMIVPFLICMDSSGDPVAQCESQSGIPAASVQQCMRDRVPQLLSKYMKIDASIKGTPTVYVNGKNVDTTYRAIRDAICDADKSLSGCSAPLPENADWQAPVSLVTVPPNQVIV